jgi:Uma2 family endonuclease
MSDMVTAIEFQTAVPVRRISVDDYHRMGEAGIFARGERVELLDGMLIAMPPAGKRHVYSVLALEHLLPRVMGERAIVSTQNPLRLNASSEPEPDIVLLEAPVRRYDNHMPITADAVLVIEVADTSRAYDRGPKLRAYQNAGVREIWIVDLVEEVVEMWRPSEASGYALTTVAKRGDLIAPATFPDAELAVDDILPRRT